MLSGFSGWLQFKKKREIERESKVGPCLMALEPWVCCHPQPPLSLSPQGSLTVGVAAEATFIIGFGELHSINSLAQSLYSSRRPLGISLNYSIFHPPLHFLFCTWSSDNAKHHHIFLIVLHNHILDWTGRWLPSNQCSQRDSWLSFPIVYPHDLSCCSEPAQPLVSTLGWQALNAEWTVKSFIYRTEAGIWPYSLGSFPVFLMCHFCKFHVFLNIFRSLLVNSHRVSCETSLGFSQKYYSCQSSISEKWTSSLVDHRTFFVYVMYPSELAFPRFTWGNSAFTCEDWFNTQQIFIKETLFIKHYSRCLEYTSATNRQKSFPQWSLQGKT